MLQLSVNSGDLVNSDGEGLHSGDRDIDPAAAVVHEVSFKPPKQMLSNVKHVYNKYWMLW